MRTISFQVGTRIKSLNLDKCTERRGGADSPFIVKREPSLETELVRFDKHIRLNGTSGTFSDYFTKVIDVKSTGKDIIIFLGFEPITASPSPPVDEKVFGHFLSKVANLHFEVLDLLLHVLNFIPIDIFFVLFG